MFFYLYLILDIYSRKIVGWEGCDLRIAGVHTTSTVRKVQ
jgi:transposase InsO family protein